MWRLQADHERKHDTSDADSLEGLDAPMPNTEGVPVAAEPKMQFSRAKVLRSLQICLLDC